MSPGGYDYYIIERYAIWKRKGRRDECEEEEHTQTYRENDIIGNIN
jgi:hypothetical protein